MLERTFSFWRRLVGNKSAGGGREQVRADRRLWIRYDADVQASVDIQTENQTLGLQARVRDISRGGVNLVVDRPFETGQILSLELPGREGEDVNTVLGCIVRVTSEKPGEWALGCVFLHELTEEDLKGFGVRRERAAPRDKRGWYRFECNLAAQFQKIGDPTNKIWKAEVLNVSASGIGLASEEPVSAGALLSLELFNREGKPLKSILTCVVQVTHQTSGSWALGCNFIRELAEADLHDLI